MGIITNEWNGKPPEEYLEISGTNMRFLIIEKGVFSGSEIMKLKNNHSLKDIIFKEASSYPFKRFPIEGLSENNPGKH